MMDNRINFTDGMKQLIKNWKGNTLHSFIQNDNGDCDTCIRFLIGNNIYVVDNRYVLYVDEAGDKVEYSCFSCSMLNHSYLLQKVVGNREKENIIEEEILDIFIVRDFEKGKLFDSGIPYELIFDTALIIQTTNGYYAFWRELFSNMIISSFGEDFEQAVSTIKSEEKIRLEAQEENPYIVTVKRIVEKL